MKRLVVLAVLLSVPAISRGDTIKLTSGSGSIYSPTAIGFSFQFHGAAYDISIPQALDAFGGGLVNCSPCDPTQLLGFPLFIASGGLLTTGDPYLTGRIAFDAVSFVSSLAPSGVLTVKFTAVPSINLFLYDTTTGLPVAGPFVWGNPNQHWIITAQFSPDVGFPHSYEFTGATLTSTPEPTSLLLLGTGLAAVAWRARRATLRRL
jgi:PEP-CTERM motif-containing protein